MKHARAILDALEKAQARFTRYSLLQKELRGLNPDRPLHLLSIGKAAWQMAEVARRCIPEGAIKDAIVLSKYGFYPAERPKPDILEAGHPIPDQNSLKHSKYIVDWLKSISPQEDLIVLLSGGTSALFELPKPGNTLEDIIALNSLLLKSGLDISQINAKRKETSQVKGGNAAKCFYGRRLYVYLLSDVSGNDPSIIGSGPFLTPETERKHLVIGDNAAYLKLLAHYLKKAFPDYPLWKSRSMVQTDAGDFGVALGRYMKHNPPGIYLFGAECCLKVRGKGLGGRLSHLALSFAGEISREEDITLCAFATDGNDNLAECAGAIVDHETWDKLAQAGNPIKNLRDFDSYPILKEGNYIIPGRYTGNNVNDVVIAIKGFRA